MRVSKATAAHNREQILAAAARMFRERGIIATGVDSITKAAGLTHGGLYSQFGSKEAIATEAIRYASARSQRRWQRAAEHSAGTALLSSIVETYLAPAHRDAPGHGCVIAALATDVARQPKTVRKALTTELRSTLEFLAHLMPGKSSSRQFESAAAAFSCMVGAVILARAVSDDELSRRILDAAAARVADLTKTRKQSRRNTR
ncbi:MAG: TetR/AcrR family transcriptional regulator [Candidatus Binataceae bacterium]